MAYSTPRTWVALENVSSTIMNQEVRDNLLAIVQGNAGSAVLTTTQNPVALVTNICPITLTTHGGPVLMARIGGQISNTSGASQAPVALCAYRDGVQVNVCTVLPNDDSIIVNNDISYLMPSIAIVTGLAAGTYVFSWRDNIGDGSPSWTYTGATIPMWAYAAEVGF